MLTVSPMARLRALASLLIVAVALASCAATRVPDPASEAYIEWKLPRDGRDD
jgi:hypothetical protein